MLQDLAIDSSLLNNLGQINNYLLQICNFRTDLFQFLMDNSYDIRCNMDFCVGVFPLQ